MSQKGKPNNTQQRDPPIAIRYGRPIADAGWSAIPNLLLDFYTYLRFVDPETGKVLALADQECLFLIALLRRKKDNEDPAVQLRCVRTQAAYATRRKWVAKLKRMGLLFTRLCYYPVPAVRGEPPRVSHIEWDMENLFDNLLALHAVWRQKRDAHKAEGAINFELTGDFTWSVQLFPATAERLVRGYYGELKEVDPEPGSEAGPAYRVYGLPTHWISAALAMAVETALPDDHWRSSGNPGALPVAHQRASGTYQLPASGRSTKDTLQYPTVPLRVPINGAGDVRTHLPLLDELSLNFTWEEQAEYVEFWLQRFVRGKKIPAANTALAKAFGRAFGFQRDGELVVEPSQGEYARLGGMAKEFQDLGGHVAVWQVACRMWGQDLQGDPLAYLAQSLIRERNERREEKHERRKRQRSGARRPTGHGYRRLPGDAKRDYLADPSVEGDRDEPESG